MAHDRKRLFPAMPSSIKPSVPDLPRLLEISCVLHSVNTQAEYFDRLEDLIPELSGCTGFTWISLQGGEGTVLFSTEIEGLTQRLHPPRLDSRTLSMLLGVGFGNSAPSIEVEGRPLVTRDAWRLAGEADAMLLLHSDAETVEATIEDAEALKGVRQVIARSWQRLRQHAGMEERLEASEAKLSAIGEIGKMGGSLDVEVLLTKLMEITLYIVRGQVGSIVLIDEEGKVDCPVEWGLPLMTARCFQDESGEAIVERVMRTGQAYRYTQGDDSSSLSIVGVDVHVDGYMCIPLTSQTRTLGAVNIVNSLAAEGFSHLDSEVLLAISSLAATSIENAILHHDSLEKERLRQSMAIARDIQQRLYPSKAPHLEGGLEVAWRSESCDETGGDYFDFVETPDGIAVIVGDVSGHGVGAALLMASARAALRQALARGVPIDEAVQSLNDQLDNDTDPDQFMTLLVLAWSPGSESIQFVNAGHDTPCIYRSGTGVLESLPATGIPLGLFPGVNYETGEFEVLQSGDALLLTTDGVWEVADPGGVMLGKPVLLELFRGFAGYPADEIAQEILKAVGDYTEHAPPRDDRTLVVFRAV